MTNSKSQNKKISLYELLQPDERNHCVVCGASLKSWQVAKKYNKCFACYQLSDCSLRCKKLIQLSQENEKMEKKVSELDANLSESNVEILRLKRLLAKGDYRALICEHLVASSIAKQTIPSLLKKMEQNPEIHNSYLTLLLHIESLPKDYVFHQQQLLHEMGWYKTSFGDLLRAALDHLNCLGFITKVRFIIGKPGHAYQKTTHQPCEFFANGRCIFDFSLGKSVEKESD